MTSVLTSSPYFQTLPLTDIIVSGVDRLHRVGADDDRQAFVEAVAVEAINAGDVVEIDFDRGVIIAGGKEYPFPPYPEFVQGLIKDGGLIPHVKKELGL